MPSSPPRRSLNVLQVVPTLDSGGAERATIDIAAALAARGDRALVASEGGRLQGELHDAGGQLIRLPVASKNPLTLAANALRLMRLIRRENIDLVHARSRAPAWSAWAACRATGVPLVTTFHGAYGEGNPAKRFYNSIMVRGAAVIANSHYTARLITARYGTPAERITIVPRGADPARFSPEAVDAGRREALRSHWGLSGGQRVVLNLARLTGWKGQRVLIEAAAKPPLASAAELVMVLAGDAQGRDDYRAELERMIGSHGLAGRVRVVGHCDDAPAALSLAEVAVIASTEPEAFGRTAIEAAAMGVPVVATRLGATEETVLAPPHISAAERTGWLVTPGDPAALASAIGEALRLSAPERGALAARARKHAETFSTASMQAATLSLYERLLSRARHADDFSKR
jgi:glycosyltransferase involved in cell wall biosynthesis